MTSTGRNYIIVSALICLLVASAYTLRIQFRYYAPRASDAEVANTIWNELVGLIEEHKKIRKISITDQGSVSVHAMRHLAIMVEIYGIENTRDQDLILDILSKIMSNYPEQYTYVEFNSPYVSTQVVNDGIIMSDRSKVKLLRKESIPRGRKE